MAKKPTIESVDASLARWKTRLKRAVTTIDKLEKQKKRLMKKSLDEAFEANAVRQRAKLLPDGVYSKIVDTTPAPLTTAEITAQVLKAAPHVDDLGIPDFLRRQSEPDPVAEQIKEEQAETKRKKARGRIEKMKAKQRGDLKKMPLTGKAALDHIRNG